MTFAIAILIFTTLQRLSELVIARRNSARLIAQGAYEASPGHYPFIVALHAAWLSGLWYLGWDGPIHLVWLVIFVLLQLLRIWVLLTLGARWTTRIIVLPNAPLVRHGPYRFMPHPNYAVVVGEIMVLPLVFGEFWFGLVFSLLNAMVLFVRIRAEERVLAG